MLIEMVGKNILIIPAILEMYPFRSFSIFVKSKLKYFLRIYNFHDIYSLSG